MKYSCTQLYKKAKLCGVLYEILEKYLKWGNHLWFMALSALYLLVVKINTVKGEQIDLPSDFRDLDGIILRADR